MAEEEQKIEEDVPKSSDIPFQTSQKKEISIQKAKEDIENERNEKNSLRRFGYFSIPYPATVGDEAYSQKAEYPNHKVEDRKVIIEKRGIYVNKPKVGKNNDAYFSVPEPFTDEQLEKQKELTKKERDDYIELVKKRKKAPSKAPFYPSAHKDLFAFYDGNENTNHEGTLTIEPDKKRFILEGGKVKIENPNIKTNPTKVGKSFSPNDYFEFFKSDDNVQQRLKKLGEKDIQDRLNKVKERKENPVVKQPFKPASLKKCEPFSGIEQTYGLYTKEESDQLVKEYIENKKKGKPKYQKIIPEGSCKHDKPFQPPRLIYQGRDGLFNDDLYKIPEFEQPKVLTVKERKELESKNNKSKRMPFTYNKLMKSSTFSPPISSFTINLKREFPTIKFH